MNIRFEIIEESNILQLPVNKPTAVVISGPRCVTDGKERLFCTYMSQSRLGINDFTPMFCQSDDFGKSWSTPRPIWLELIGQSSIFCNISRGLMGELFVFGSRTRIDTPGESFWSEEHKGLKANELIWANSRDDGRSWTLPHGVPLPYAGSAEAPGPMLVTRGGRWIGPYSPYNLMDGSVAVDCGRVIAMLSDDGGKVWKPTEMIRFDEPDSVGAEAWVTELSDGRILGTTWHADLSSNKRAYPNCYAISKDGGETWSKTRSTGITANTTALSTLPDGRALFITVRRRDDVGIWLSVVKPSEDDFGVLSDQRIWSANRATQNGEQANHDNWTAFTFGEPAAAILPDGSLFLVFWYLDPVNAGVRYLRLRIIEH
jgi:hypothetical protein